MAVYKHGIYTSEVPTSIVPPVETEAGLPVIFGTAPLHLVAKDNRAKVNRPVLCNSYDEAVAAFGYSEDWKKYTLCEAVYSMFALYNRSPVVLVNVLDPDVHKTDVADKSVTLTDKKGVLSDPVLLETLVVKGTTSETAAVQGTDYEAAHDDDGNVVITIKENGALKDEETITVSYTMLDPSAVTAKDIIGGVDGDTGAKKGLETLNQVFPITRLVPGAVLAPGWSHIPEVEAIMKAKAGNINEHFKAMVLVDAPADTLKKYSDVPEWKNANNYTGENEIVCWPMAKMGNHLYHLSTQLLGVIATTDSSDEDGVPYQSPSNKSIQITGLCLADGTEVIMTPEDANYLNGQGIVTALNFIGGWKSWGNRTACYPSNTDAKDAFISVKRMFYYEESTFIQTYWNKVDDPANRRLINTIVDSENIRLNGLVAKEALLGGRIEFRDDENPETDLLNGKLKFHTYMTPPMPAREIEDTFELDPDYLDTLFA